MGKLILDSNSDNFKVFSNHLESKIYLDGIIWRSVAQYYQTQKFESFQKRKEIIFSKNALEAEKIGTEKYIEPKGFWKKLKQAKNNPKFKENWKELRYSVLKKGIKAKILQNYSTRKTLFETKNKILLAKVESTFWGYEKNGENNLGKIFMEIRSELTQNGPFDEMKNKMLPPWIKYPNIPGFSLFWKMGEGEHYNLTFTFWYHGLSPENQCKYKNEYPPLKNDSWIYVYDKK